MLQHERIDASEGIYVNKTSASKECQLYHHWSIKDVGFKFEEHVCNGYYDLLTMPYSLKNIAILSAKRATFRCLLMGVSKNEALKKLRNSVTYDRGILQIWILAPKKTSVEVIREGVFGGTYFRDIYSNVSKNGTQIHGKNLIS